MVVVKSNIPFMYILNLKTTDELDISHCLIVSSEKGN